jgi:hypothetical protein
MANTKSGLVPMAIGIALSLATIYSIAYFAGKGWEKATNK